ncbi:MULTISPECIES: SDR family NAD(P)-dependent oxidoreductase [Promicromonospora]|uniref:SDR family NAD(P)-dependent oxidoreductase n=2 Tax=Promicromonospora TaxID=43676 RepID=A0ABW4V3N3_9MICO
MSQDTRIAVVTGANRGLGREVARALAEHGMHVVVTARDARSADATAEELKATGLPVSAHQLDVTDPASVARAFATIGHQHDRLDVLVNNAAIAIDRHRSAALADMERVTATLNANITGAWRCCSAAIPEMQRHNYGRIINVTSHMATTGRLAQGSPAYRVSKAGLNALTQILADELRDTGILVNAITPGMVDTRLTYGKTDRPPADAAGDFVRLATLPNDGPTGRLYHNNDEIDW